MKRISSNLHKAIGPGILFASTAIGVSHLVQSTRAGAMYSFGLLAAVVLANLFKYPFFEFGTRYANVRGESLIDGYRSIGKWMLWVYIILTLLTMFFVSAAVGAVTGGFMAQLIPEGVDDIPSSREWVTPLLFAICVAILLAGAYKGLDRLVKLVGSVLLIASLLAFALVIGKVDNWSSIHFELPRLSGPTSAFPFVIALMGWMPTAVDLSAWNSLWTLERIRETGYRPSLKESLFDFKAGYWISALLALVFLSLGALLMHGTVKDLPQGAVGFTHTVLSMYSDVIGAWAYPIIAVAAFSVMFGTCIAVFDGYARSASRCIHLLMANTKKIPNELRLYRLVLLITAGGAFVVVSIFGNALTRLIDFATILSFVVAPVVAAANFYLVAGPSSSPDLRPSKPLRLLAWLGLLFLSFMSIAFLYVRFLS